jgi:hypothetical protein
VCVMLLKQITSSFGVCVMSEARSCFLYHSSVLHSEQGKLYFNARDGIVSTMAYSRAANTHAFTWYGTATKTFFPPRYLPISIAPT